MLQRDGGAYSILYFSDHGLLIDNDNLRHGHDATHRQTFHVPLMIINSGDTSQRIIKAERSGFEFLDGFSQWIGVETAQIPEGHFFDETPSAKITVLDRNSQPSDWHALADNKIDPAIFTAAKHYPPDR